MCADCEALKEWASEGADCFCWSFGNVHIDVLDFIGDSGDEALIAEAQARVQSIRSKRREPIAT